MIKQKRSFFGLQLEHFYMGLSHWPLLPVFCLLLSVLFGPCSASAVTDGVLLVANRTVPVEQLSRSEVRNIFLSKIQTIQGVRVRPVMSSNREMTKQFLASRVGKTPAQFSSYYRKMIFTGRGRPLPKIDSDDAILAYVRSTSGAMGYVRVDAVTDDVKVIRVVE